MSIWDKFDDMVTVDEVMQAKDDVWIKPTAGKHEVELLSIEPAETRSGVPQLRFKFKDLKNDSIINHNLFLARMTDLTKTPALIVRALAFVKECTGVTLDFVSMSNLEEQVKELSFDGTIDINVSYANENSKYPNIEVLERHSNSEPQEISDEELPF